MAIKDSTSPSLGTNNQMPSNNRILITNSTDRDPQDSIERGIQSIRLNSIDHTGFTSPYPSPANLSYRTARNHQEIQDARPRAVFIRSQRPFSFALRTEDDEWIEK